MRRGWIFILGFFMAPSLWAQSADADKAYLMDVVKSEDIDPSAVRAFYAKDGIRFYHI